MDTGQVRMNVVVSLFESVLQDGEESKVTSECVQNSWAWASWTCRSTNSDVKYTETSTLKCPDWEQIIRVGTARSKTLDIHRGSKAGMREESTGLAAYSPLLVDISMSS